MKIIGMISPFTLWQKFVVYDNEEPIADFSISFATLPEELIQHCKIYDIHEIDLHGNHQLLSKVKEDIEKKSKTQYSEGIKVNLI